MHRTATSLVAVIAVTVAAAALALAPAAGAATVSVEYAPVVKVEAGPGERNIFTVQFGFKTSLAVVIRDDGVSPLRAVGPQCVKAGPRSVVCVPLDRLAPFSLVEVFAGDRDDRLRATGGSISFHGGDGDDFATSEPDDSSATTGLSGDAGDDVLEGGDVGINALLGGDGDDVLTSGTGLTVMFAGAGDDVLNGGPGHDGMDGGPGADVVRGGGNADFPRSARDSINYTDRTAVSVTTDGLANDGAPGEHDNVGSDVETVFGSDGGDVITTTARFPFILGEGGDDVITLDTTPGEVFTGPGTNVVYGSTADDNIIGGNGNDTLDGRGGNDILRAFGGDDLLLVRDGRADELVECGDGNDRAQIDVGLDNPIDCELLLP